jgi:hypothetical protein
MAISYLMETDGYLLKVWAKGKDDSPDDVYKYMAAIVAKAIESESKKILCDERQLEYAVSILDTFELAEEASKYSGKFAMIAIVCNKKYLKDGKFYETVASNRGLKILVTDNYDDAVKWLA